MRFIFIFIAVVLSVGAANAIYLNAPFTEGTSAALEDWFVTVIISFIIWIFTED